MWDRFELRGSLAALWLCKDPEVMIEGRAGTGKSLGALVKVLKRCQMWPNSRHLLVRMTRASMTESTLVTFEKIVGETHPEIARMGREQRHSYHLFGSEIVTGGLDKPERLFSTEWDTIVFDEAIEAKTVEAWDLFGRAMRHGATDYHQRIALTNPGAPLHWLTRRATPAPDWLRDKWHTREDYDLLQQYNHHQPRSKDHPLTRIISVHPDNPRFWDADKWEWKPEGDEYVNGVLANMSGHRRARMFDGRWRAADNVVYPEFDERHVVKPFTYTEVPDGTVDSFGQPNVRKIFKLPEGWHVYVLIDPGYDHPTAILWLTADPDGKSPVYVFDEIYEGGKAVKQHGEAIHFRNKGRTIRRYYADPQHAFSSTAQSPDSIAMQYRKHASITLTPWPRTFGNEETMVEAVREMLRLGRLLVTENCENTIMEFQTWSYARDMKGQMKGGEDKFEDANNHAMDCIKGGIAAGIGKKRSSIKVTGSI